jgi:hypothetical protein
MGRVGAIACVLLTLALPGDETAKGPPAPRLAVRIVPSTFREEIGRAIELYQPSRCCYVVITNTSGSPVRLWREWCSWGYFNLSFVVADERGRTATVTKRPRGWDKNFPDWSIVPPGDHMVFAVSFDASIWQGAPLPERGGSRTIKMRAVYEVSADEEAKKRGVWIGRISSPEGVYTFYR